MTIDFHLSLSGEIFLLEHLAICLGCFQWHYSGDGASSEPRQRCGQNDTVHDTRLTVYIQHGVKSN
jgi:hypothetical protein